MNHASAELRHPRERVLHISHGEVRQRGRVARPGAPFVNAEHGSAAPGLPTATIGLAALGELDAEQAGPEPTCAIGIVSRELD
jgi:hypothetical protein